MKFFNDFPGLSFPSGERIGILERADKDLNQNHSLILTIDDNDFVRLSYNTLKLEDVSYFNLSYLWYESEMFTVPNLRGSEGFSTNFTIFRRII